MKKIIKPKWHTPKLIVLVREKLEERVLAGCKDGGFPVWGPGARHLACIDAPTDSDICQNCSSIYPS